MTATTTPRPATVRVVSEFDRAARLRRRRRRGWSEDGLVVMAWVSAAVALSLFLASGLLDLGSTSGIVTALGIGAGLVGSDLVLVMLVLVARIPLIDRAVGHDRALAAHRRLGKPALYLLVAHGLLLTIGYGLADGRSVFAESVSLFFSEDMPLAYLSLALFIAVVVTSLVIVRRRLPYEAWHVVHLLSYAAVLAAIPHQLSQGGILAEGSVQRAYWIALYVVAFAAIAIFRVARPVVATIRHDVRVSRVEASGHDAVTIHFTGRRLDQLGARGGQFFFWRFLAPATWWHVHPLSLSAETTDTTARVTVRVAGAGTGRLARIRPGTRVAISGPFGIFTEAERTHDRVALIAAGIGITPIRALMERIDAAPGDVTLLVRGRTWREVYLWAEIEEWAARTGHAVYVSIGPRAGGDDAWLSQEDVGRGVRARSIFPRLDDTDVFICGPDGWADAVEHSMRSLGVARRDIHRERFAS